MQKKNLVAAKDLAVSRYDNVPGEVHAVVGGQQFEVLDSTVVNVDQRTLHDGIYNIYTQQACAYHYFSYNTQYAQNKKKFNRGRRTAITTLSTPVRRHCMSDV